MKANRLIKLAAAAVLLLVLFIAAYFSLSNSDVNLSITLPERGSSFEASSDEFSGNISNNEPDKYEHLESTELTRENVKSVISTLYRCPSYTMKADVRRMLNGEERFSKVIHTVSGGRSKTEITSGDLTEHILCRDGLLYRWTDGDTVANTYTQGSFDSDDAAQIPTYETVLSVEDEYITDASYKELGDSMYVFVEYKIQEFNYTECYYLSTDNGLLMAAETYDGDELIYSMKVTEVTSTPPEESVFTYPTGE